MPPFSRLIRFESDDGKEYYGELPADTAAAGLVGTELAVYDDPFDAAGTLTFTKKKVTKILSPIAKAAHIYGVGLNYKAHAEEAGVRLD